MNLRHLGEKIPAVIAWIDRTLAAHAGVARPVDTFGGKRLASYYPAGLLASAQVLPVAKVPVPQLASFGLGGFGEFERLEAAGITYRSSYFVVHGAEADESLHFHELVHVCQWRHLGAERFLMAYALGFVMGGGYRANPLRGHGLRPAGVFRAKRGGIQRGGDREPAARPDFTGTFSGGGRT